jgi:hypothetical protein
VSERARGDTTTSTVTLLYGEPDTEPCKTGKPHCAHHTGRSHTDGMGQAGGAEVECCFCGKRCEVAWRVEKVRRFRHGPYQMHTQCVYDWPANWKSAP